jgi:acetoin utilization protein AcuB
MLEEYMFIDASMTRDVVSINQDAGILEARDLMKQHRFHHLPVVDQDNTLIGIVTDRDILRALPSAFLNDAETERDAESFARHKIKDIMSRNVYTVSPTNTLEDALLLMEKVPVGAFPVVDQQGKLQGIISIRDLMRAFINVLGIHEPGTLLCILAEDKLGTMKRIVDAISEERIPFGSILVARHWQEGKRAVFPYLLSHNVAHVKRKLEKLGFQLLNPMEWYLDRMPKKQ